MKKQKKSSSLEDYYQSCPFPKPAPAKKKKLLYNGYKDKPDRRCYYTGRPGAERHEIWGGPWRQTSREMGFQVDLSPDIHRMFHENEKDWIRREILWWRRHYQAEYENKLIRTGITPDQARQCWMALIGRNYL